MDSRDINADKSQAERFRAMAEELECDPDEAAFKAKLARIAKAKSELKDVNQDRSRDPSK